MVRMKRSRTAAMMTDATADTATLTVQWADSWGSMGGRSATQPTHKISVR